MSIGLIGTKIGMTREFMETGQSVPVTVIRIEKGRVLDIITKDKRGYDAVKIKSSSAIDVENVDIDDEWLQIGKQAEQELVRLSPHPNEIELEMYEKDMQNIDDHEGDDQDATHLVCSVYLRVISCSKWWRVDRF